MKKIKKVRIGVMGFGRIGRQLYQLAACDESLNIVAISDIGSPEILHYLLTTSRKNQPREKPVRLEGNYLIDEHEGQETRTRLMSADRPSEIPWDLFGVDLVVDATGRFRSREDLQPHLDNGAQRVLVSTLPEGQVDRVILYGVNQDDARAEDRIISGGSASTTAMALALKTITDSHAIVHATMTSVHSYTSDQSLQDYAGADFRRSRSGAENIIPNESLAPQWVAKVLPSLATKLSGYALNVPVQEGSMLDMTVVVEDPSLDVVTLNELFVNASKKTPRLIQTIGDPIVSSDVKGCSQSLLVDLKGTMKAGARMLKLICWHESLGHAQRLIDIAKLYADLDADKEVS